MGFNLCSVSLLSAQRREMRLRCVLVYDLRKSVLHLFRSETSLFKLLLRKPSHVEPDFFSFNIVVCITTAVEADQGKAFM